MRPRSLLLPALLLPLLACGGSVVTNEPTGAGTGSTGAGASTGSGATTGAGASSGTGATTGAGGSSGGICPASPPATASPCNLPNGTVCSYGDEVTPTCRQEMTCSGAMWTSPSFPCPALPPAMCPSTQPAMGTVCQTDGTVCTFGDTICICNACALGPCMAPPPKWQCQPPPTTLGCPALAPNSGTGCTMEGLACSYGYVCGNAGADVTCTSGVWVWSQDQVCGA